MISFVRGDNHSTSFKLSGYKGEIQKAWLTVKDEREVILIKKNTDNGIEKKDEGFYVVNFEPKDTDNLDLNFKMFYDFQIMIVGEKYTPQIGSFKLTKDITTPDCEV